MEVRFNVNLVELRRACRRLIARLADESENGTDFIAFTAIGNMLIISTRNFSEALSTTIGQSGRAQVPRRVFCSLVHALCYCSGKPIEFDFAAGTITLRQQTIRHHQISVNEEKVDAAARN